MALLDPFVPSASQPWNARRVAHLYRRLGFGATVSEIQAGLQMSPLQLVDKLIDEAIALPSPAAPSWSNWVYTDYEAADPDPNVPIGQHRNEMYRRWIAEMLTPALSVRAKMALFLSNLTVTGVETYGSPPYQFQYFQLIHEFAFGNFKEFINRMGKSPAMLVYLNGNISVASEPNENYARELMELFTMGENNGYTQVDIVEMARALTGWRADNYNWEFPYFEPSLWDDQPKTVFGQTGNYNFKQAHDLIFEYRKDSVAHFIPKKIYRAFVYQEENQSVISALGDTFKQNYWELAPVLRQLFKSEHFFSDEILNTKIKSPLETMLNPIRETGIALPDWTVDDNTPFGDLAYFASQLNQEIYNPPNVAGWPGHHAWLNENTLTYRWSFASNVVYYIGLEPSNRELLRTMAMDLTGNSNNPYLITSELVNHFIGQDLEPIQLEAAVKSFKDGVPENYFIDGSWNLSYAEVPYQILNLMYYLVRLPEFQLV